MEIINATSNFLNTYPICPPILMAMLTCGLIPIILLIYLIQKTAVHSNCRFISVNCHKFVAYMYKPYIIFRYLITMWCSSFCGMFVAYFGIVSLNIISDKGYFPSSMFEPGILCVPFKFAHKMFFSFSPATICNSCVVLSLLLWI